MPRVLDVQKVDERPQNYDQGHSIEGPGSSVDELVSPQQQLGFNTVQVFTSDECIHCCSSGEETGEPSTARRHASRGRRDRHGSSLYGGRSGETGREAHALVFRRDRRPRVRRSTRASPCLRVFRPTPVSLGKIALWVGSRGARAPVSRRERLCLAYTAPLVVAASIRSFNNGMMSVDSFIPTWRTASMSGGFVSRIARVRPFAP